MSHTLSRFPLGFALVALASGCGGTFGDYNPRMSQIELNATTMPEASRVSVPMPPPQAAPMFQRAEAASLWQQGSTNFFADQRANQIGDILTIAINIDDEAQLSNASARSRQGSANMGFPAFFGYGSQIDKVLPDVGPEDLPTGDIVDLDASRAAGGSGKIDRAETINLKVAALVVQTLPNGNMVIAGRQEVMVNSELRELRVAGIIRPQDIQRNNVIAYDKIAEARITYAGRGQISRQTRTSLGEGALDIILPY
ncbi:MAG: flagellar basal body L-ring protein FlgH [Pseudomonadota bacterium]